MSIECWFLPSVWNGQILGSNLTVPMPRTRPYGPPGVFLKTFDKVKCLHILFFGFCPLEPTDPPKGFAPNLTDRLDVFLFTFFTI
jgi:hypothetical protein